jgi:hypothetical protein
MVPFLPPMYLSCVTQLPNQDRPASLGLCAGCQHARQVESSKGSTFYRCELAAIDPAFPKYPSLPVLRCSGYAAKP